MSVRISRHSAFGCVVAVKTIARQIRYRFRSTKLRVPVIWVRHRGLTSKDVVIASYPRSGNTWMRFLLYELLSEKPAQFRDVNHIVPYVGSHYRALPLIPGGGRLLKTHELPRREYSKAIYLVRDVRDVVLSDYDFETVRGRFTGTFEQFIKSFVQGEVNPFSSWQVHVQRWLSSPLMEQGRILLVKYENLRQNTEKTIARVSEFIGLSPNFDMIRQVVAHNSLKNMRDKEERAPEVWVNFGRHSLKECERHIRTGTVRGWQERLSKENLDMIYRHTIDSLKLLGYD